MLTAEWYFCLRSIGILNMSCFETHPSFASYVQPAEKISSITEHTYIKGKNARNLSSDSANPVKCLASFSGNSNGSFCDMHFIGSTILSCCTTYPQFSCWWHDPSFLTVGLTTYCQSCGASRGSQRAPIFCASTALMHEQTCPSCFRQSRANQIFHHRYVDNTVVLLPAQHLISELDYFTERLTTRFPASTHPFGTSPRLRTVGIQCRCRCIIESCYVRSAIENCYVCSTTEY